MEDQMEIGSFLELKFLSGLEYYVGDHVARLNTGRAAILHAIKILNQDIIYLPYYQCETVKDFLLKNGVKIKYYYCDRAFNPLITDYIENAAILLVNYFGIMSSARMCSLASKYKNVIIDNSQAFFAPPIANCMNVYSARKFIGAPDGAYLIGSHANDYLEEYEQDYSSDTSLFLLQRIEYGCAGKAYENKKTNDDRIDNSSIKKMSKLTHAILDGTDYNLIKRIRKVNFEIACSLFKNINKIDPTEFYEEDCVPMVYPLVIEDNRTLPKLIENNVFQGHWWSYILDEVNSDTFEYYLSKNMIPITIDQRYGEKEIKYVFDLITSN
ncbi:hypothetical protein [[Clostridium] fimetarium]|uniref:dTDP-4-amino-4,6-dideoxygalactose transaminase n=1 Tax=[Clostridium] fimetarium TaxID=99656 RepID=A0A1I0RGM3_9FIRM|nr:hypothetical protein [[Clostridium] fimetarium]SEW39816.1 hypothetical protein SAMN05421659_11557 [[Clostridium] fimetarium]